MDDLLSKASQLWRLPFGTSLRLIGGLGVRALVGPLARVTHDVDLVVTSSAGEEQLRTYLIAEGWVLSDSGTYIRARSKRERYSIDIFRNPVANPRTFELMQLSSKEEVVHVDLLPIRIADPNDLAFLKICAARDQDAIDLALLAASRPLDPSLLVKMAIDNDLEIRVAEGAMRIRANLERGDLDRTADELLGRPIDANERAALTSVLEFLKLEGY